MQVFGEKDHYTADALDVVAKYDPATYARMQAADWWITSDPDAQTTPASDQWVMDRMGPGANAVTISPWQTHYEGDWYGLNGKPLSRPYTLVNLDAVLTDATVDKLNTPAFLAGILVHEFQHTQPHHHFEAPAYEAGTEFYRKLPARIGARLVLVNNKIKAMVAAQG